MRYCPHFIKTDYVEKTLLKEKNKIIMKFTFYYYYTRLNIIKT